MKDFLLICDKNCATYKEVFPLFKQGIVSFGSPVKEYEGTDKKFGNHGWITTFPVTNKKKLVLSATYDPALYPKYDNYDAIEVAKTDDIPDDWQDGILGAADVAIVEQLAGGGSLDGVVGTVLAATATGAHQGRTAVLHDGVDILEVAVDIGALGDNLGDTLGCREQHVIGHTEGCGETEVALGAQLVVVDDDDGVYMLAELLDASLGLGATARALEAEGACNDSHNENLLVFVVVKVYAFGYLGDDGSRTGAGTTSHTGGDEEHLRVVRQSLTNVGFLRLGGLFGALRLVACPKAKVTQRNLVGHRRSIQGFHIGVADDKVHSLDTFVVHVVYCIAAAAANTDNLDVGRLTLGRIKGEQCRIYVFFHVLAYFYLIDKDVVIWFQPSVLAV